MTESFLSDLPNFQTERQHFLNGRSKPSTFLEACIRNIEAKEPTIRAFAYLDLENARHAAREADKRYSAGKPLSAIDGMPIVVKDIIDTKDMPTEMNSPFFAKNRPRFDAACVAAARLGGAVLLGKSVTTEFALGRSGPTTNPHNTKHTPGGSSSGTAAGAASGMFPAGFATQTQGSILRPASFNGVVGFKPSHGALSIEGIHPVSQSHDHLGAIGQSVDDAWGLSHWIARTVPGHSPMALPVPDDGPLPAVMPQRLAVARLEGFEELDGDSLSAFENCLEALKARGVTLVEPAQDATLAEVLKRMGAIPEMSPRMVAYDMLLRFRHYCQAAPDQISQRLHEWVALGEDVSFEEYRRMLAARDELRRCVQHLSATYDAVVLPAASGPAPEGLGQTGSRTLLQYWTFLGFPAFSLPMMQVRDMPLGLQLGGFGQGDHRLAQHAKWLAS
ncbi:MAG: amidase [Roseinatronobacter sp.]